MTGVAPWPAQLVGTPAVEVIERALSRERLGHSLLLHGDDIGLLEEIARAIGDRLLADGGPLFGAESHPDSFALRPAGKMRIISADATRDLIGRVQVTAAVGRRKVATIYEADRMNEQAANIFLKTLEEPPANSTLLLLTTRPYALLSTIRSRCLHFRFPGEAGGRLAPVEGWPAWIGDYGAWLGRLGEGPIDKTGAADLVFSMYGLVARFRAILDRATDAAWTKAKESLPAELEEEEQVAMEIGMAVGIRTRLLAEVEIATQDFARPLIAGGDDSARRSLVAAVERLEHDAGLLRVNLDPSAALEDFLLASMRLWSRR